LLHALRADVCLFRRKVAGISPNDSNTTTPSPYRERLADSLASPIPLSFLSRSPRAPWQNGFAERFVGTIRRDLLDHVIVLGERHLQRLVRDYVRFYNNDRPHMALDGDAPAGRATEGPELGEVVALPRVGGLHHRYSRAA
jgi:hypothetical protein